MRSRVVSSLSALRTRLIRGRGMPLALVVVGLALLVAAPAQAGMFDVAGKLMCQCGCGAVLSECPHVECGWGVPAKEFIGQELANGKSEAEIVQYYVAQEGEKVLASPPKTGFNMTAWIMPFAGLFIGAAAIYFLVTMWARRHADDLDAMSAVSLAELTDEDSRRLDDDLKRFD